MADNRLNAQQLQRIQQDASAALQVAIDRMQLRKWAIEQVFTLMTSPNLKDWLSRDAAPDEIVDIAKGVYDFVSQAAVVKVDVSQ